MRNVILSLVLVLGCSTEGDGLVAPGPDAGALKKGVQASGVETGQQAEDAQPRASQDAQAPDFVVVADARPAQPDTLVMAPDTYPSPPPVTWEPGPETTDPGLMVCPPTKGNSLGIGKACSNDVGGVRCPSGTFCLCGGDIGVGAPVLVTKTMPCMCVADRRGDPMANVTCPPCGEGAGCCSMRADKNAQWLCLPSSCADAYCRVDSPWKR
jgi:hypothetical protein